MNCRLILSLLVWCAGTSAFAQRPCRVFGTVRDSEGQPIALASVRIAGKPLLTVANIKGEYALTCASNDSVTVVYSMLGYETRKHTLLLPKDSVLLGCGFAAVHGIVRGGRGEIAAKTDHSHTAVESRFGERGPFGHRECGGGDGDCTGRGVDPQRTLVTVQCARRIV